jgi:integrase
VRFNPYLRDLALLLAIYAGALTRSEASTLRRDEIGRDPKDRANLILTVNPTGEIMKKNGEREWIAPKRNRDVRLVRTEEPSRDPVRALGQWISNAGIAEDAYVFRGVMIDGTLTPQLAPRSIQHIITARREMIDDAGVLENVSTHSIRLAKATQLAREGKSDEEIAVPMGVQFTKVADLDSSLADVVARSRGLRGHKFDREPLTL